MHVSAGADRCTDPPRRRRTGVARGGGTGSPGGHWGRRQEDGRSMDRRNSVEIQAISVDEAVRLALEQLGRQREEVEIEVLAEPTNNGTDEEEALVRVTVRGQASQPARGSANTGRTGGHGRPGSAPISGLPVIEPDETTEAAIAVATELLTTMGFQVRVVPQQLSDD